MNLIVLNFSLIMWNPWKGKGVAVALSITSITDSGWLCHKTETLCLLLVFIVTNHEANCGSFLHISRDKCHSSFRIHPVWQFNTLQCVPWRGQKETTHAIDWIPCPSAVHWFLRLEAIKSGTSRKFTTQNSSAPLKFMNVRRPLLRALVGWWITDDSGGAPKITLSLVHYSLSIEALWPWICPNSG